MKRCSSRTSVQLKRLRAVTVGLTMAGGHAVWAAWPPSGADFGVDLALPDIPTLPIESPTGTKSARFEVVGRNVIDDSGNLEAGVFAHEDDANQGAAILNYRALFSISTSTSETIAGGYFTAADGGVAAWAGEVGTLLLGSYQSHFSYALQGRTSGTTGDGEDTGLHYGVLGFADVGLPDGADEADLSQYGVFGGTTQATGIGGYFSNTNDDVGYAQAFYAKSQGKSAFYLRDPVSGQLQLMANFANDPRAYVATIETTDGMGSKVLALYHSNGEVDKDSYYIGFLSQNRAEDGTRLAGVIKGVEGTDENGVVFESYGADFAEYLPKAHADASFDKGDIVAIHNGKVTRDLTGAHYLQVVSSTPVVAGNMPAAKVRNDQVAVAFIGQVPVKVRGPVAMGDYILAGDERDGSGVAMAPGLMTPELFARAVGRAIEASGEPGLKKVRAIVGLGFREAHLQMQRQALRIAELEARLAKKQRQFERLAARVETLGRQVARIRSAAAVADRR